MGRLHPWTRTGATNPWAALPRDEQTRPSHLLILLASSIPGECCRWVWISCLAEAGWPRVSRLVSIGIPGNYNGGKVGEIEWKLGVQHVNGSYHVMEV